MGSNDIIVYNLLTKNILDNIFNTTYKQIYSFKDLYLTTNPDPWLYFSEYQLLNLWYTGKTLVPKSNPLTGVFK